MRVRDLIAELQTVDPDLFVEVKLAQGYHCAIDWAEKSNPSDGPVMLIGIERGWEADFVEEHSAIVYISAG